MTSLFKRKDSNNNNAANKNKQLNKTNLNMSVLQTDISTQ